MQPRDFIKAFAVTAAFWSAAAQAQTYPSRPIVMVVPYAAGGTFDVMGRILAARMSELLNQPVIVENTTGAGGIIGVTRVINAPPDGYTVLLGSTGTHAYNQTIYKKRPYDAINDFTPVALFSEQPMVLEVRKDLPNQHHPGVRCAPQSERREDAIRLRRRRHDHAPGLLAAQLQDRRERHACTLSGLGAGCERSDRRADRLPVRQPRRGGAARVPGE
jgi:hypothetical protein